MDNKTFLPFDFSNEELDRLVEIADTVRLDSTDDAALIGRAEAFLRSVWIDCMADDTEQSKDSPPERTFPIMDDVIKSIPWSMIEPCAEQVSINHYQTLQRISERGGLSPGEAVAVLERRRWRDIPKQEAREQLLAMIQEYEQQTQQAYRAPQSVLDLIDIGLTFSHAGTNRGDCKEHFGIDDCVRCLTDKAATDLGLSTEPKRDCDACLRPVATLEGHSVHVNGVAFWLHPECETFVRKVIDAANPPKASGV